MERQADGHTDGQRENSTPSQTQFAGDIKMGSHLLLSSAYC